MMGKSAEFLFTSFYDIGGQRDHWTQRFGYLGSSFLLHIIPLRDQFFLYVLGLLNGRLGQTLTRLNGATK